MLEEQVIRIEIDAAKLAVKGLLAVLKGLASHLSSPSIKYGQQSMKALNRQGRALSSFEVVSDNAELRKVRSRLKAYSVDFALEKDKGTGKMYAWFKGQDVERIEMALKGLIAGEGKTQPHKRSIKDICSNARQKAAAMNAERKARYQERGERV